MLDKLFNVRSHHVVYLNDSMKAAHCAEHIKCRRTIRRFGPCTSALTWWYSHIPCAFMYKCKYVQKIQDLKRFAHRVWPIFSSRRICFPMLPLRSTWCAQSKRNCCTKCEWDSIESTVRLLQLWWVQYTGIFRQYIAHSTLHLRSARVFCHVLSHTHRFSGIRALLCNILTCYIVNAW